MRLPDLSAARLLIVGDVMLDRYWFGDVARISPEAPVPVVRIGRSEERPGGAANELESLLGIPVDLLTPADLPPKLRAKVLAEARPV